MPKIEENYIKTGKVKYIVRDFPLESIHKKSFKAHEAANCAGEQGKYWEMHAKLFSTRALAPVDLENHASTIGLNMQAFKGCLESGKYASEIRRDMAEGRQAGTTGTPAFYLGLTVPDSNSIRVTKYIKGAQPYDAFVSAIEELIREKK